MRSDRQRSLFRRATPSGSADPPLRPNAGRHLYRPSGRQLGRAARVAPIGSSTHRSFDFRLARLLVVRLLWRIPESHSLTLPIRSGNPARKGFPASAREQPKHPLIMNVFVLSTGRCGSQTFAKACRHMTNFFATHESNSPVLHAGVLQPYLSLRLPDQHIEVDNRLSWFLGTLEKQYGDNAYYVHLLRRREEVAQ